MDKGPARKRGRPRIADSAKLRAADDAIGRTVWQLLAWGYPLRRPGGVADVVGAVAADLLKRTDPAGRALGPDRIEQIFKEWIRTARRPTGWFKKPVPYGRPWSGAVVSWLRATGPRNGSLHQITHALLSCSGEWRAGPLPRHVGDVVPTPATAAVWARMPRMRVADDSEGSG